MIILLIPELIVSGKHFIGYMVLVLKSTAINKLCSDTARKSTKKLLVDMFNKAVDSDLLINNTVKQINTVVTKEEKKERRALTVSETELFLDQAKDAIYYNLFVVALETGMRIGELCGLRWSDIDFKKKSFNVSRTLCYFSKNGKYVFEMHDTKTQNGRRTIPLTANAITALKMQKIQKQEIIFRGKIADEEYNELVFVTRNNKPTQEFAVQRCIKIIVNHIQTEHKDFEHFVPHTFRHSFATRAIENGMQPKRLQRILGYSSLQMTMDLYCHVTEDTLFEELKKMERKRA